MSDRRDSSTPAGARRNPKRVSPRLPGRGSPEGERPLPAAKPGSPTPNIPPPPPAGPRLREGGEHDSSSSRSSRANDGKFDWTLTLLALVLLLPPAPVMGTVDFAISGIDPAGDVKPDSDWTFKLPPDVLAQADILQATTRSEGDFIAVGLVLGAPYTGEASLTVNFDTNGDYKTDYALVKLSKRAEFFRFSPQGKVDTGFITVTATGVGTNEVSFKVPVSEFKGDLKSFNVQAKASLYRGRGTDWGPGSSSNASGWFTAGPAAASPAPLGSTAVLATAPKAEASKAEATPTPTPAPPPSTILPAKVAPSIAPVATPRQPGFEIALALVALLWVGLRGRMGRVP